MSRLACLRLAAFAGLLLAAFLSPAQAADVWVTRYDDPAPNGCLPTDCSLREAVIALQSTPNVQRIYLSAGRYELTIPPTDGGETNGDLDIQAELLEIHGAGAGVTTIDMNGLDRIATFINAGFGAVYTVSGITFTGGQLSGSTSGTGVGVQGSKITFTGCEFTGNVVVANPDTGAVVDGSIGSEIELRGTTIAGNTGSGVKSNQAVLLLENSTISANSHYQVHLAGGTVGTLTHTTVIGTGTNDILVTGTDTELRVGNSIIQGECAVDLGAIYLSQDGNLQSPGGSCLGAGDHVPVANLNLGGLALNGGATRTHLPAVTSAALGNAFDPACTVLDQRGAVRPDVNCDSGSVERVLVRPLIPLFNDGFGQGDAQAWSAVVP